MILLVSSGQKCQPTFKVVMDTREELHPMQAFVKKYIASVKLNKRCWRLYPATCFSVHFHECLIRDKSTSIFGDSTIMTGNTQMVCECLHVSWSGKRWGSDIKVEEWGLTLPANPTMEAEPHQR